MADSLNKGDLVAAIAGETGLTQTAVAGVLDAFFGVVASTVAKGTKVAIPGLGLLRADRARCAHRPEPGDGCHHPDPRVEEREGLGGQQAQGCGEVTLAPARTRRRTAGFGAFFVSAAWARTRGRSGCENHAVYGIRLER